MEPNKENRKKVSNRLSRLEGQIRAVRRMVEENKDCEDIVTQLSAVHSALEGVTKLVVANFFLICLEEARQKGDNDEEAVERFVNLLLHTRM
ncbi:MAG: metal-sensitive transcriptional regulator [Bacillota bacterium]